jgi:gamma-glutamylcyclotransferase (GGCT)/AIG2-like uncharacterized protein YtfP
MPRTEDHLFVYGSLLSSIRHPVGERLRREASLLGEGSMQGRLYRLRWYPGAVDSVDPDQRVFGEVYLLRSPERTLRWLDAYEGLQIGAARDTQFERVARPVRLAGGRNVEAWVYLLKSGVRGLKWIRSGRWEPP